MNRRLCPFGQIGLAFKLVKDLVLLDVEVSRHCTYFTYLGLLQLEHRPSTIPLQHTRFWAASHAPFQLSF